MRLKITFVFMAVIAVLVVGCGGGGDSTGNGTNGTDSNAAAGGPDTDSSEATTGETSTAKESDPLTKAEFIKQADAICEVVPISYQEHMKELEEENGGVEPSKTEENLKAALPPIQTAAKEMKELNPPASEEEKVEAIIKALEAAATGLEEKPVSELSGPKSPFNEFQKLTARYGLKACSQL